MVPLSKWSHPFTIKILQIVSTDGWMICNSTAFLTVFQSYNDDGWKIIKGCMQWFKIYDSKDYLIQHGLESGTDKSAGTCLNY